MLGSSYGLESAVLKCGFSYEQLIDYWSVTNNTHKMFPASAQYHINFVDLELNALKYADQVKLCDRYLVADMSQAYSEKLESWISSETDIITAIGIASYIGQEGFERLINSALVNGTASAILYSLPNFESTYSIEEICENYGLRARQLGSCIKQRRYASSEERDAIKTKIIENNIPLQEIDEQYISTILYLITN